MPSTTTPNTTPNTNNTNTISVSHPTPQDTPQTAAQAHRAWHHFLAHSPYSPLRLEHDPALASPSSSSTSWRPTPWDLPQRRWEENSPQIEVGWLEAFEDLMRVESGLGLVDWGREMEFRRGGRGGGGLFGDLPGAVGFSGFGGLGGGGGLFGGLLGGGGDSQGIAVGFGAMGVREAAWLGRMRRHGLSEVLFPVSDPRLGYQSPRTMEEWAERRRVGSERVQETGRLVEELFGDGKRVLEDVDAWAEEAAQEVKRRMDAWEDAGRDKTTSFFDGLGGVVRTLGKVLEDEGKSMQRFGKADENSQERKETTADKTDAHTASPETENDLYSAVQSAFHESERSLSNFFKAISEGQRDDRQPEPKPASPAKTETTETVEDGVTKKTTKKEYVDKHGNTHSKTETTWIDENGHVVMRQVHSSMGRSDHWEKTIEGGGSTSQDKETTAEERKQQKTEGGGWFWK
jgi:hypothetical protein